MGIEPPRRPRLGVVAAEAAIDPSDDEVSIYAVHAMRESFASSDFAPAALKFFDALLALLTGEGRRQ